VSASVSSETDRQTIAPRPDQPSPALAAEIDEAAKRLDAADAVDIISWAVDRFGSRLVVATSLQDCVLIDLAVRAKADIPFVFLDTGFSFPGDSCLPASSAVGLQSQHRDHRARDRCGYVAMRIGTLL